ncbi:hypothetical protein H2200_012894 [Cladophialophora chaetospira]|uniref:Metallo-beta-lactamase domain-containing protein n=1 Tax=Cladophialophora chaetospira TaxID=386627 RepID=A0AA38WX20_9EURO|nr:hypothetical protein H2200_012894 [Cladophialophora chaetospira]
MSPGRLRRVQIPKGSVTITTKILDLTTISGSSANNLYYPPIPGVERVRPVPSLSFLLEHPSGKKLLFELGVPKDIAVLGSEVADRLKKVGHRIEVEKDVVEVLEENGIKRGEIDAVIWSQTHWDHKGDIAQFPPTTTLVLGPKAKVTFLHSGGNSELGGINERDIKGREIHEVDFEGPGSLQIGRFRASDYFRDGSLYLLDTPGHSVGHLCALVRPTADPPTFVFFGGDCAHHCAEVRPSEDLPLPASILPNPLPSMDRDIPYCPGSCFEDLNISRGRFPKGPLWQPKWGEDLEEAIRTIGKMQEFDGEDNVLLLLAHDSCEIHERVPTKRQPEQPRQMDDVHRVECQVIPRKKRGTTTARLLPDLVPLRPETSPQSRTTDFAASSVQRDDESEALQRAAEANAFPAALHDSPNSVNRAALSYTGDDGDKAGSLGELLKPVESSRPMIFEAYLVPGYAAKKTPPEELEFLRVKGAYSIPPKDVCDQAVFAFFRNAHPLLPVLDAKSFLDQYFRRGCEGVSLILLWSILHVAASFLPIEIVRKSGYQTRKAMKLAMYQHVKLLYDNNQETDHFALLQAVIILGYWHPDSQDRFEAWHWTGIAISMAQSMRLHRESFGERPRGTLPAGKMRLARRIWGACLVRDRWLAFIKGRPMRIHLEDCDMPLPSPSDISEELDAVPQQMKAKCIAYSANAVGELWCELVRLSILLGRILTSHSKNIWRADAGELQEFEANLQDYKTLATIGQSSNLYDQFFACQVRLHHESIAIVLFRPFVLSHPKDPIDVAQSSYWKEATQKTRAAANNMNAILEQIMNLDLVQSISPAIISPLILAMQIHLLDCKSSTRSISRLGLHRLQLCMMFQGELKDTYWGADGAFRTFKEAQEKLLKTAGREGEWASLGALPNVEMSQPTDTPATASNSLGQSENVPSIDDLLTFDFAFDDSQDFFIGDVDYL